MRTTSKVAVVFCPLHPLTPSSIKKYFSELGCRVTPPTQTEMAKRKLTKAEIANHHIAKLKLPLKFPTVGGPRQTKRRG